KYRELGNVAMNSPLRRTWIASGITLEVIRHYFEQGKVEIRIAAGFFTVKGYNLIRTAARGKRMLILVGIEEPGEDRARLLLVQQILRDLKSGVDVDRRSAVIELVEKLRAGTLQIVDARALDHHAKAYIIDEIFAVIGSSNTSAKGFVEAIESGHVIDDPGE